MVAAMDAAAPRTLTYLNAASHGLPDERVRARMASHLARESEIGAEAAAGEAEAESEATRQRAAGFIGAKVDELALMTTTTLAWGVAVAALPLSGARILVAENEWASNIAALQRLANSRALSIEVMPVNEAGDVDLAALEARVDDDVAAICTPMVSSLTGRRYPVEEIGRLPRPEKSFYIVDAAQALGQMPVDVTAIGCDVLAATTRKWLRSPRGLALLYVGDAALARMTPQLLPDIAGMAPDGASGFQDVPSARRFETGDYNLALRLGLGAAIDVVLETGIEVIESRIGELAQRAHARGVEAGLVPLLAGGPQSGIVSFVLPEKRAARTARALSEANVAAKFPALWNEPFLTLEGDGSAILRIAPHVYNGAEDVDRAFAVISGV